MYVCVYVHRRAYISSDLSRGCEVESETRVVVSHAELSCDEALKSCPFLIPIRSLSFQIIAIVNLTLREHLPIEL